MSISSKKFLTHLPEEDNSLGREVVSQLASDFSMYSTVNTFSINCAAAYALFEIILEKGTFDGYLQCFKKNPRLRETLTNIMSSQCGYDEKLKKIRKIPDSELASIRKSHIEINLLRVKSGQISHETIAGNLPGKCYLLITTRVYLLYFKEEKEINKIFDVGKGKIDCLADFRLDATRDSDTIDSEKHSESSENKKAKFITGDWCDIEKRLLKTKDHEECQCNII